MAKKKMSSPEVMSLVTFYVICATGLLRLPLAWFFNTLNPHNVNDVLLCAEIFCANHGCACRFPVTTRYKSVIKIHSEFSETEYQLFQEQSFQNNLRSQKIFEKRNRRKNNTTKPTKSKTSMGFVSCSYVTPLRIVAMCITVVGFILHVVGLSAKKWDGIDLVLYAHRFNAYQNLWGAYDTGYMTLTGGYTVYGRMDTSIPAWKIKIIILEATGLGFAVVSFILLLASFVNRISQRRKIHVTMIIIAIIGCLVAAVESIIGVKLYQEQYRNTISKTGKAMMAYERQKNHREIYGTTWAPYMCIGAGGTYAITAVLLIMDLICVNFVTKRSSKTHVSALPPQTY